ncbi:phosphate signaling complex protein PhoU [bacterium]|nr:phosphate signaling complex protein PhoU [bacterium]
MTRIVDPVLEELRQTVLRMGSLAEAILSKALRAVWERDAGLALGVPEDDLEIDRIDVALDEEVTRALALQSPVGVDLRRILAIRTMASDLERVGDLARNIANSAVRLAERTPVAMPPRLEELADQATRVLSTALDSFTEADVEKAQSVLDADDTIDHNEDQIIQEAIAEAGSNPDETPQQVDFILIAKHLERVGDHATNIAEEVIFLTEARIVRHEDKFRKEPSRP